MHSKAISGKIGLAQVDKSRFVKGTFGLSVVIVCEILILNKYCSLSKL